MIYPTQTVSPWHPVAYNFPIFSPQYTLTVRISLLSTYAEPRLISQNPSYDL